MFLIFTIFIIFLITILINKIYYFVINPKFLGNLFFLFSILFFSVALCNNMCYACSLLMEKLQVYRYVIEPVFVISDSFDLGGNIYLSDTNNGDTNLGGSLNSESGISALFSDGTSKENIPNTSNSQKDPLKILVEAAFEVERRDQEYDKYIKYLKHFFKKK